MSLIDQLAHGVPVRNDEPVVAPAIFENLGHRIAVGRGRHAAQDIERTHDGRRTGLDAGLERRQVGVPERLARNLGRNIVAPGFRSTVTDEVFQAGRDRALGREVVALIAAHRSLAETRRQVGVLAVTLGHTPPAGVARHIDHRREGPVDARVVSLARGVGANLGGQIRVPRSALRQRNGRNGPESVDDIVSEKDGNTQPRIVHGVTLDGVARSGVLAEQDQRTDPGGDFLHDLADVVFVVVAPGGVLVELQNLLIERHQRQQAVHPLLDEHVLVGRDRKGTLHGIMRRQLRPAFLLRSDRLRGVCVALDRPSRQRFEPCAGSRVTAVSQFEVIAVAVERVALRRGPGVLNGRSRRDDAAQLRTVVHRAPGAQQDAFVHLPLAVAVEPELLMLRILGIGPRLVEINLQPGIGGQPRDVGDQVAQIGLVGHIAPRFAAGLLKRDDVPLLVPEDPAEGHLLRLGAHAVDDLAVGVCRRIARGIVPVAFERTTADIHVADHGIDARGIEQIPEVLLDGVLRETVADGQNLQGPVGGRNARRPGLNARPEQDQQERRKNTAKKKSFHGVIVNVALLNLPVRCTWPKCCLARPSNRRRRPLPTVAVSHPPTDLHH